MATELLEDLQRIKANLVHGHNCVDASYVGAGIDEIVRLRASQFRWIPFSERMPEFKGVKGVLVRRGHKDEAAVLNLPVFNWQMDQYPYWAPIPPLPEKSQAQSDLDKANDFIEIRAYKTNDEMQVARYAFIEGLRAAREEKP